MLEKRKAKKQAQAGDQDGDAQTAKPHNDKAQRVYKQKMLVGKGRTGNGSGETGGREVGRKADVMAGVMDSLF